jgi:hypothetical protein
MVTGGGVGAPAETGGGTVAVALLELAGLAAGVGVKTWPGVWVGVGILSITVLPLWVSYSLRIAQLVQREAASVSLLPRLVRIYLFVKKETPVDTFYGNGRNKS